MTDDPTGAARDILTGAEVMQQLYPGSGDTAPGRSQRFWAIPNDREPRMFMPAANVAASRAMPRARRVDGRRQHLRTWAASALLAAGGGRAVGVPVEMPAAGSIEDHLALLLGRPVMVAVFLGPPRANRKPVVQVMDERGTLLAVAKVGLGPLTGRLARQEARALEIVGGAGMSDVLVPSLISGEDWRGHTTVVQSPLDITGASTRLDSEVVQRVTVQIARVGGIRHHALAESRYLQVLRSRVDRMQGHPRAREAGNRLLTQLAADPSPLPFGAWHGDLTRWNIATRGQSAMVWDWERFAQDVPLGFDSLHHVFLPALAPGSSSGTVGTDLLRDAAALLAPHGVEPGQSAAVAGLYLLELASRFSVDGQAATSSPAGAVEEWLLPTLARLPHDGSA